MNQPELDPQPADLVYTDENGPYCKIPLSRGLFAKIDPEDWDLVMMFKWHATYTVGTFYAMYSGYRPEDKSKYALLMHRVILGVTERSIHVDHRDHDTLNNRQYNIRAATVAENARNKKSSRPSKSGLLGAIFNPKGGRWVSRIKIGPPKKIIHLGTFDTPEEAHEAYKAAATKYHGEFACY